jgi:molybdate transport system substrate-binding protein
MGRLYFPTLQRGCLLLGVVLMLVVTSCATTKTTTAIVTQTNTTTATTTQISTVTTTSYDFKGRSIDVFAGSASQPPLEEAAKIFEKNTGAKVNLTLGGSGTVLSQMILSKSGDLYIPGSPDYMITAQSKGVVAANDNGVILSYLVPAILVQKGNPKNIQSLNDLLRADISMGIGNPATVCVGLYAIEVLDHNGLLDAIKQASTVKTYTTSCDATAALIALKQVDAVLGWSVFASWNPDTTEAVLLKPSEITRLAYIPGAVSTFAKDKVVAQKFLDFLSSTEGLAIFAKYGYQTTESEVKKFAPNATIGGLYTLPAGFTTLIK